MFNARVSKTIQNSDVLPDASHKASLNSDAGSLEGFPVHLRNVDQAPPGGEDPPPSGEDPPPGDDEEEGGDSSFEMSLASFDYEDDRWRFKGTTDAPVDTKICFIVGDDVGGELIVKTRVKEGGWFRKTIAPSDVPPTDSSTASIRTKVGNHEGFAVHLRNLEHR